MKIAIINGPNLNLLGNREPGIYGNHSFESFYEKLKAEYRALELTYYQSNVEGELVTQIQKDGFDSDGVLINAGAYTHTSIAIRDAIAAVPADVLEIHISNVFAREEFRHETFIGPVCKGSISGLGLTSYQLGVEYFLKRGH